MWRLLFPVAVIALTADPPAPLAIDGPAKADPYTLVEMSAKGQAPDCALVWDVLPEDVASVRELPGGRMVFTGPPGKYTVKLRAIVFKDNVASVTSARTTVVIGNPEKPPPIPPHGDKGKADPVQATVRLRHGNSGCTATIIGPKRNDGKWDALTASHCTGDVGSSVQLVLKDGREFKALVKARDRTCDLSWLRLDGADGQELPYAQLAGSDPPVGTKVWHNGYGVDKPGNREDGTVTATPDSQGQTRFTLSVSPGDSGGGIFRDDTGELVSAVCCTTTFAQRVSMWGGCSTRAMQMRPKD